MGDFADVEDVAVALHDLEFDYLFLGPTGACPVTGPVPASPYSPQSRQAGSILHIRPERLLGWRSLPRGERRALRDRGRRLNELPILDMDAARDLKLAVLRAVFAHNEAEIAEDPAFETFRRHRGLSLTRLSHYFTAQLCCGPDWRDWPEPMREESPDSIRPRGQLFFAWCEWEIDKQLARAAAAGVPLVTDLPVGTPHAAADAWLWRSITLSELQLGSPPDYFNPHGHQWGLVPFDPRGMEQHGFLPLLDPLDHALRHAAGVRIDHGFGLIRLYCINACGGDPRWLPQPRRIIPAVADRARGAGRFIVTEELGSAPPEGEAPFREHGFYKQVPVISDQFDPASTPEVVSVTCHDLPTLAGCLHGQVDAPVLDHDFALRAKGRLLELVPDADRLAPDDAFVAINRAVGALAQHILVTAPEDVLGLRRPVNLPGVPEVTWPSFRCRLPVLDEWVHSDALRTLVVDIRRPRPAASPR